MMLSGATEHVTTRLYVLDTSVAIAWYLPEVFSKEACEWQKKMLKKTAMFLVPQHLHFLEFGNVLRTYIRRGELRTELAHEIYELHLEAPLREVAPAREHVLETALEFDSTTYDAAYIALSLSSEAPLVTAERSTTPWVVQLGSGAITMKNKAAASDPRAQLTARR